MQINDIIALNKFAITTMHKNRKPVPMVKLFEAPLVLRKDEGETPQEPPCSQEVKEDETLKKESVKKEEAVEPELTKLADINAIEPVKKIKAKIAKKGKVVTHAKG